MKNETHQMRERQNTHKKVSTKQRSLANRKGYWAEQYAALYLRLRGYKILQMRYRNKFGEVDVIARKKSRSANLTILIEVKNRRSLNSAIDAVNPNARKRIAKAGQGFIANYPKLANDGLRYDVIAVVGFRLHHLRDAWRD